MARGFLRELDPGTLRQALDHGTEWPRSKPRGRVPGSLEAGPRTPDISAAREERLGLAVVGMGGVIGLRQRLERQRGPRPGLRVARPLEASDLRLAQRQ